MGRRTSIASRTSARHDDCAARTAAVALVAMRHARIEIHRVAGAQGVLFPADMHAQPALQYVDELDARVIVQPHRCAWNWQEVGVIRIESSLGYRIVERLQAIRAVAIDAFRKPYTLPFPH